MAKKPPESLEPGRLPWNEAGPYCLVDADGQSVCTFSGPNKAQNRALVLAAVNWEPESQAALVEFFDAEEAHRQLSLNWKQTPTSAVVAAKDRLQMARETLQRLAGREKEE